MRFTQLAAFVACTAAAQWTLGQIPPDPLGSAAAAAPGAAAGSPASGSPGAPGGSLPQAFVTRQSDVEIPFSVRPGTSAETQPTAVRVFVSWDRGQSWHFYDERRPEEGRFRFRPRQDGEFWFATQTVDRSGRTDLQQPRQPQLRLVIDTQRPQLIVQAQLDSSGNVQVAWSAVDPNLVAPSFKIEYQDTSGSGGIWQSVELPAQRSPQATQLSGQATFRPAVSSRTINLRAEIADAAGNQAFHSQRLSLVPPAQKTASPATPPLDTAAVRWTPGAGPTGPGGVPAASEQVTIPSVMNNPWVGPGRLVGTRSAAPPADALPAPQAPNLASEPGGVAPAPGTAAAAPSDADIAASSSVPPFQSVASSSRYEPRGPGEALPAPRGGLPSNETSLPPTSGEGSAMPAPAPAQPRGPDDIGPLPGGELPLPRAADLPATDPPRGPSPELVPGPRPVESVPATSGQQPRLTNSRRFNLDYDIQTVGPEGVEAVELWGSTDGGRNWVKWGTDPDKSSPFDVEVNHEAVYGFRIVVVGKNGLATSTPQPGEAADIWVGIDLTPPQARLTGATYGQGDAAGKLEIRWQAADEHLGSRPVTLLLSDRPDGPFAPIAAGLPNSGQYYWEYDPRSPRQIYLRLEVRDEAGNVAIDQLSEPIKVEGLEPKGRIRGFNPGHEEARRPFQKSLFR